MVLYENQEQPQFGSSKALTPAYSKKFLSKNNKLSLRSDFIRPVTATSLNQNSIFSQAHINTLQHRSSDPNYHYRIFNKNLGRGTSAKALGRGVKELSEKIGQESEARESYQQ